MININKITYIESCGHDVKIHMQDNTVKEYNIGITEFGRRLPQKAFVRCHKQYIVNINEITEYKYYKLTLDKGTKIPVGRKYKQNLQIPYLK